MAKNKAPNIQAKEYSSKIKFDSESCNITDTSGEVIGSWNEEAVHNYPEDLTWDRDIGSLIRSVAERAFLAGATANAPKVKQELVLAKGDDWESLYANGKRVLSGHKIDSDDISKWSLKTGSKVKKMFLTSDCMREIEKSGESDFPKDLKNLKLKA